MTCLHRSLFDRRLLVAAGLWLTSTPIVVGQDTGAPLEALPAETAAGFEETFATLDFEIAEVGRLDARLASSDGVFRDVLATRRDNVWTEMFSDTIGVARAVADRRDAGFDVSEFTADAVGRLGALPAEAYEAIARARMRVIFPATDLPPNEFVIQDQALFQAIRDLDAIFRALIAYIEVAARFEIDTTAELSYLEIALADSAANRSTFLEKAITDVRILQAATSTLSDDTELAARLSAANTRVRQAATTLQQTIELMSALDLETRQYRQQVLTVTGEITADVLDVGIVSGLLAEWSQAAYDFVATQGPRFLFRTFLILLILFVFYHGAKLARTGAQRAVNAPGNRMSFLLRSMIVSTTRNVVLLIGVLFALSQIGISLGPLLAGLGIAGIVVGFALQDSLSNFASGVMILAYRPFDVGDVVDAAGVRGRVNNMSLVNTTFMTLDNQTIVVPNNLIWQSVITNLTAQTTRRIDLEFGISYGDDIEKAEQVLRDVVTSHEAVLDEPEPIIRVNELADSSVNFIVRPWVKTEDYWETYWDLIKAVKLRFDREGITIPFPQREVHVAGKLPT